MHGRASSEWSPRVTGRARAGVPTAWRLMQTL
jgi:hypothetical protein